MSNTTEHEALCRLASRPGSYVIVGYSAREFARGFAKLVRDPTLHSVRYLPPAEQGHTVLLVIEHDAAERGAAMVELRCSGFYADAMIETGRFGQAWVRPREGVPFRVSLDATPPQAAGSPLQAGAPLPAPNLPPSRHPATAREPVTGLPSFITRGMAP